MLSIVIKTVKLQETEILKLGQVKKEFIQGSSHRNEEAGPHGSRSWKVRSRQLKELPFYRFHSGAPCGL